MGCTFSKVKENRRNNKNDSIKINTDIHNEIKTSISQDVISNSNYIKKENNKSDHNVTYKTIKNGSKDFTKLNNKKKEKKQELGNKDLSLFKRINTKNIEEIEKDKTKVKKIEQVPQIEGKEKTKKNEKKKKEIVKNETKFRELTKIEKINKKKVNGTDIKQTIMEKKTKKEKENDKENKFEKNSFTGIINTINNNLMKRNSSCIDKKKNSSISKIEGIILEEKEKLLYKKKKDVVNDNKKKTEEYYDDSCVSYKKKEEKIINTVEKNKEALLYYHDFRNVKLKKNYFTYIYEFYKYNDNSFNLFSLMPCHIAVNLHESKILFESSLIGKYLMLPWIENDPDIKNNLYLKFVLSYFQNKKEIDNSNKCEQTGEVNYCGFFQNKNEKIEKIEPLRYSSISKKHLWKFESEHNMRRKLYSINKNGTSIKKKNNKYMNRNFSIDNLYKIHSRKSSYKITQTNKKEKKNDIDVKYSRKIKRVADACLENEKNKENIEIINSNKDKNMKKENASLDKKKKENDKIGSTNKIESYENPNLRKIKNGNGGKIGENTKSTKEKSKNINEKKEINEKISSKLLDHDINNCSHTENLKKEYKKKVSEKNINNNKYDYYITPIEHTRNIIAKKYKMDSSNMKNNIKIIKKNKKIIKPSYSFEEEINVELINNVLKSKGNDSKKSVKEKNWKEKKKKMRDEKEEMVKYVKEKEIRNENDEKNKKVVNMISNDDNRKKIREIKENQNKNIFNEKDKTDYQFFLKNEQMNNYEGTQKLHTIIKKKSEIHNMTYEGISTKEKNRYKKYKELKNENYSDNNYYLNKKKGNNNIKYDELKKDDFTKMNKLENERNTLQVCDHKYKLNENYIKKNYISCGKCNKKRCIFHYLNSFKLYGWLNFKWTDPDGFLELSNRQKKKFYAWKRLSELYDNPVVMTTNLYSNCIRQGFVADCSFLSSLTVLIEYEKKHKIPVLSSIISPYTSHYLYVNKTWPIFNPSGMYICRLHCNGIQRKIIIDDYVPVKINNTLLVAYSNNQQELWVTLLEKAFVKLMGGSYSMFGSNPGSDLYYLTGWVPVTISFKSKIRSSPPSFDKSTIHSLEMKDEPCKSRWFKRRTDQSKSRRSKNLTKKIKDGNRKGNKKCRKKKIIKRNVLSQFFTKKNNYIYKTDSHTIHNSNNLSISNNYTLKNYSNLNLYRFYKNINYSYLKDDYVKYKKLKAYWNFKRIYLSQKNKIKKYKKITFKKNKEEKTGIKNVCSTEDIFDRNKSIEYILKKNNILEHSISTKINLKDNNLINKALINPYSLDNPIDCYIVETSPLKDNKFPHINIGKKKKIPKEIRDYEINKNYKNKFLNEEISNMDLSSYVCESVGNYSDINKNRRNFTNEKENEEYDKRWDIIWNNIYDGIKKGKCVVCLGTLELKDAAPSGLDYPEGVSMSTGIVTRHAYSILNIEKHNGDKLLYIKNPWGCIRWKGKYSHHDITTWTKELQKKLNYSIEKAKSKDDGCFWIPWVDVVKYFSHIYICWNSAIFAYQFEIHTKWENNALLNASMLLDDTHLVAYNPQFALHVNVRKQDLSEDGLYYIGKKPIEIWVLLSRHVRERKTDVSQKYLALHVHAGKNRIICPLFPIKQGIYSNGECTFTKLVIGGIEDSFNYDVKKQKNAIIPNEKNFNSSLESEQEVLRNVDFVLIVSQYSQKEEFNFTLKVYSNTHLSLYELPPLLPDNYESFYFKGEWTNKCAGGCSNNLWSYFRNPHIRFYVPEESPFCIFLECSQEHSVNLRIFKGLTSSPRGLKKGEVISSGAYKAGCCFVECTLKSGVYCLIPSLYRTNTNGNYQICIHYPKFKKKPVLYFIPYAYSIPPFSFFKYKVIHLYSLTNYSIILFHTTAVTLLSLRVTFFQNMDIKGIPLVNIYKLESSTDSINNDCKSGNIIKNNSFNSTITYNGYVYRLIEKCNIHGSSGNDILPLSTCAYDYYIKFNSVLISLVELENNFTSYLLLITTNIKEDVLYSHEAHFISDKTVNIDAYYPSH